MKDLSITQEYMIFALNKKGSFPSSNSTAIACLVVSGVLEMQLEGCISLNDKKLTVCAKLPENLSYLKPLYNVINQGTPVKAEKVVEAYTVSFSNKKLNELTDALINELIKADIAEPAKAERSGNKGTFSRLLIGGALMGAIPSRNKDTFVPKKEVITGIIEKIRAELLEDGKISEEVIALTALMDKAKYLNEYFSKFEQQELKGKLEKIRNSDAGTLVKEMVQHIDDLIGCMLIASVISTTT